MKVRIEAMREIGGLRIFLDDKEVTSSVNHVDLKVGVNDVPTIQLGLIPKVLEIVGDDIDALINLPREPKNLVSDEDNFDSRR